MAWSQPSMNRGWRLLRDWCSTISGLPSDKILTVRTMLAPEYSTRALRETRSYRLFRWHAQAAFAEGVSQAHFAAPRQRLRYSPTPSLWRRDAPPGTQRVRRGLAILPSPRQSRVCRRREIAPHTAARSSEPRTDSPAPVP